MTNHESLLLASKPQAGHTVSARFLRDSGALVVGQVGTLAVAAILGLLAARWLGASGKGELVLAFAVGSFLAPLGAGGIDSYIAARSKVDQGRWRAGAAAMGRRAAWWGGLAIAAATVAYGLANSIPLGLIAIAAIAVFLRPAIAVLQAIATSEDRVASLGRVLAAIAATQLLAITVLAFDGATANDFALTTLTGFAVGYWILSRSTSAPLSGEGDRLAPARRREAWRFGQTVVIGDFLQLANYRLDVFILAAFVPIADVGVYAVAVTLAEIVWQLPQAISRSLLPRISGGDMDRSRVVRVSVSLVAILVLLSAAGLALASKLTVPVLGADYARVPGLLAVLLPGIVLMGAAKPLAAWTLAHGRPGRNLTASAIGFVVVVAGDLLLIPHFGLLGAAITSTFAYAVTACVVVLLVPRAEEARIQGNQIDGHQRGR